MRRFHVLILFLALANLVFASKVVPISGLSRPASIAVDKNQVLICDEATICIYSLKDFSLQKKFGKKGEGPEEFRVHPNVRRGSVNISVQPDYLFISSLGKISYFTRNGTFKKEMKVEATFGQYWPIGEYFVGISIKQDDKADYISISLHNSNFEKIKELDKVTFYIHGKKINAVTILKTPSLNVYLDKILVNDFEGVIYVFDKEGNKLHPITHEYPRVKVTEEIKARFDRFFKTDFRFKARYNHLKQMVQYPSYFPPIRSYKIADGKIYVVTYKEDDVKKEFFILDINGKLLKKTMITLQDLSVLELYPYAINNGRLYQLVENPDQLEWELHITEIN